MSELLFGQFANMNSFELEVAQKLAIDANIYQPVFGDNGVINIFMRETEKKEESKKIILPLDILKIKSEQLFSKEAIEELKNKFISTPDYILLEKENEKIKLIPIDAKGGKIPFIPKKTPKNLKKQLTLEPKHNNQISAYNLAYLIQQSTYLQVAIERAKQDLKSEDVEIHNGYYYMKKENTEKQTKEKLNIQELEIQNGIYKIKKDSQQKLEEKIKEELKQKNITGSLDLTSNNQTLKLMNPKISEKKNTLFITNKEYLITELNWPTFLEELGFIKNKIKYRGFYGTPVVAIGANSQGEIIKQLEYNPNTRIKTYSPRQKKLNEILKEIDEQVKDQTEILKKIPSQIEEIIHTTTPELAQEIYEAALNKVSDNLYKLEIEQLNERKERIIQSLILTEKDLINIEKKKKNSVNELEKNELINEYNKKKQEYIEKIKNRNELLEKIQTRKTEITKDHESGMLEISNFSKESEIESEINNILQNLSEMNYKSNTKLKPKVIKLKKLEQQLKQETNEKKEIKEKYNQIKYEIITAYKSSKAWYTLEGFKETEDLRNKKINYLKKLEQETKINIYKLRHKKIEIKRDVQEEKKYVDQENIKREQIDKKNTSKIKQFHKEIPYKIARTNLKHSPPQTLYINLNNNKVYKIEFYNKEN